MSRLAGIKATQDRLSLSRSKVEDLIRTRQITAVKIGSAVRVVEESIDAYIERLVESAAQTPSTQTDPTTDQTPPQDPKGRSAR